MTQYGTAGTRHTKQAARAWYAGFGQRLVGIVSTVILLCVPACLTAQKVLTLAREVHDLPASEAVKHIPVDIIGTVTLYEARHRLLFVEDESGAVFVNTTKDYGLHDGDRVEITGTTDSSFRTLVQADQQIRVLGHIDLPRPVQLSKNSYKTLMSGAWDCRRVTLPAKVRSALINTKDTNRLEMQLLTEGGIVNTYISSPGNADPASLLDADVLVTGVTGAVFNANMQEMGPALLGANASDIKIVHKPRQTINELPQTRVDDIMKTQSVNDTSIRVRVRGIVTAYKPGDSVIIRQNDRSLTGFTAERIDLPLGSVVDLSGFATAGEYGPALKQVTIMPTGEMAIAEPYHVTYQQALSGIYNEELIALRGKVLSQTHTDSRDQLTLLVEQHPILINLMLTNEGKRLPVLAPGTGVEVRGICRVTVPDGWHDPGVAPMFFRIDMRSAKDVAVVKAAPWWTTDHLLELLGITCIVSLGIALWAATLRRRVTEQTGELQRSTSLRVERSRLMEAIGLNTTLTEWITELRKSCAALLPDFQCYCEVYDATTGEPNEFAAEQPRPTSSFAHLLHDAKGIEVGRFVALWTDGHVLTRNEREILEALGGLASIAVNQRRMSLELNYTSTHDQLTGLPNRRMADKHLEQALHSGSQSASLVVAHVDINDFKQVNDLHGDKVGDQYLQQIAARLKNAVRGSDMLARIGGDEFLLIADASNGSVEVASYRQRLNGCFKNPFIVDGHTITGTASVGMAVSPEHGLRAEDLKRQADLDLYAVKYNRRKPSRTSTALYSPADLEDALARGYFTLFYQPLFCSSGKLCGLEALLRLNDPVRGIVAPDAFIEVAEEDDVIIPIGEWVLKQAVFDALRWNLDKANARVMVNVCMRQLEHPHFAATVLHILHTNGLPARCLELEITERMWMENPAVVTRQLTQLRESGVQIAIDDFGVQHSSLSSIRHLPFDTLKLDRTFIHALDEDERAMHIVEAIISIAQKLGKRIVAEGIETEQHIAALAAFDDIDLQGYYFSRPRPGDEIHAFLANWVAGRKMPKTSMSEMSPRLAMAS